MINDVHVSTVGAAKLYSTASTDNLQDIGTFVAERIQFRQELRRRSRPRTRTTAVARPQ